jgi:hypothetical protein
MGSFQTKYKAWQADQKDTTQIAAMANPSSSKAPFENMR